jgi:hypothetical protein
MMTKKYIMLYFVFSLFQAFFILCVCVCKFSHFPFGRGPKTVLFRLNSGASCLLGRCCIT